MEEAEGAGAFPNRALGERDLWAALLDRIGLRDSGMGLLRGRLKTLAGPILGMKAQGSALRLWDKGAGIAP